MSNIGVDTVLNSKYKLLEKNGKGVLGTEIFLGKNLEDDSDVLIRIIPRTLISDPETLKRFTQSTEMLKKLNHDNILSVIDSGEDNGECYLVTSYTKGYFLNEYLEHRGTLDESEAVKIIKSLADALRYAWENSKIIHRNISPETVFIAKGNIPKLTDFDLAKSLESNSKLTMDGFTVGSPMYMSPEQARGEDVDFKSDIYCLGIVFYQLLTGKPPFAGNDKMKVLTDQISTKHKPLNEVANGVSDHCEAVLDKMLEKDVANRYASWDILLSDLDKLIQKEVPSVLENNSKVDSAYKMQAIQTPAIKTEVVDTVQIKPGDRGSISVINQKSPQVEQPKKRVNYALILAFIFIVAVVIILVFKTTQNKKYNTQDRVVVKDIIVTPNEEARLKEKSIVPEKVIKESVKDGAEKVKETTVAVESKSVEVKPIPKDVVETKKEDLAKTKLKEAQVIKACIGNMKQISLALQMYANVFDGKFPDVSGAKGLDLLRSKGFLEVPQVFIDPSTGRIAAEHGQPITENTCDFVYVGGLSTYSKPKTPILWTKPETHKKYGIILYVNGDIETFHGDNWIVHTTK